MYEPPEGTILVNDTTGRTFKLGRRPHFTMIYLTDVNANSRTSLVELVVIVTMLWYPGDG